MKKNVYFVSGIDTNIGKSYATAYLAKTWNERGIRTITEKLIQTGNTDMSEDIELHRRIMGTDLLPEDKERLTMPEIFSYPCSTHLAAEIDKRPIDFDKIELADTLCNTDLNSIVRMLEYSANLIDKTSTKPCEADKARQFRNMIKKIQKKIEQ